jgi:cytosine/adenosine deaminase-related metal-dependent hydrolase
MSYWVLRGASVAIGPEESVRADIIIRDGWICSLGGRAEGAQVLDLSGYLMLPGLINAHDHLDFNLYPRLGRGPYPNAEAWAHNIHKPAESPVREQLRVASDVRLLWGGLKNLLSGVTTVAHHNPLDRTVFGRNFPVRVLKRMGWAHSFAFSPDLAERFHATRPDWPFIVHLGEGTDAASGRELDRLDELKALDNRTVLVHGVALDGAGFRLLHRRGAALVWCPTSNLFVLGRTLGLASLSSGVPIALGSDSAITADGDLLDELRAARSLGVDARQLYRMVTSTAARVLRLHDGEGAVAAGGVADLVAVRDEGLSPAAALTTFFAPELVMLGGQLKLISPALAGRAGAAAAAGFHRVELEGRETALVAAPVPDLMRRTVYALGSQFRLAGRRLMRATPLTLRPVRARAGA